MPLNRRQFIKTSTCTAGSLILFFKVPLLPGNASRGAAHAAVASSNLNDSRDSNRYASHYCEITPDNQFYFVMDKSEMGQGVITGQTTLFGDEAEIDPNRLQVRTAGVAEVYASTRGQQITGGSTSTNEKWLVLREAGATVRDLMLRAAAQKWEVDTSQLRAENATVFGPGDKQASYGELVAIAVNLEPSESPTLKDKSEFRYIGKTGRVHYDSREKSTGVAEFGIDFETDGMKVAIVERCPTFGGQTKQFNAEAIKQLTGVQDVFPIFSGVAIVCDKYWQADQARQQLKVEWDLGKNAGLSSQKIVDGYREQMDAEPGGKLEEIGDIKQAIEAADEIYEAEYELPYLAHATMEPMNCAAHVKADSCEVWSPNQSPTLIRNAVAKHLALPRDKVNIHTSKYLGGGFGRRSTLDYSLEAVEISRKINAPVKVIWSREDDNRHSPMRPINVHRFKAAIKNNEVSGWQHQLACESLMLHVVPGWVPYMLPGWVPDSVGRGLGGVARSVMRMMKAAPITGEGAKLDYQIPNRSLRHYSLGLDIPIHFWRSVGHSYNGFVVESFIDELAAKLNKDPFEFRRELLPASSRIRKVLERVARDASWGEPATDGIYQGIACHTSFKSYVAQVAEVEVSDNQVNVKKVYCAIDCGIAVNPDIVVKQMESGIIYGLSAALHGEITLEQGAVQQDNFDSYPALRLSEIPEIQVSIIDSSEHPTGAGEPGLPPIAAAVANAVFKATGQRLRKLPLRPA